MKKVILVGKITDYYRQASKKLMEKFEVKTCVNQVEIFKRLMEANTPDIVVIVYDKWMDTEESILREIHTNFSRIPAVCIETAKDEDVVETVQMVLDGRRESMTNAVLEKKVEMPVFDESIFAESFFTENVPKDNETVVQVEDSGKKSVLLVDDSGIYLRTLKGLIGDTYDVRMTTSGLNVLTMIQEKRPDIILLDYEMPLYDGKQTMMSIREAEIAKDIPIVFVTAVNRAENIKAVLKLKPDGYLLKPVEKDRLIQTIKEIIGE